MSEQAYQLLDRKGTLSPDDIRDLFPDSADPGIQPVETEWQLAQLLGRLAGCEVVDLSRVEFEPEAIRSAPQRIVQVTHVLPLYFDGDVLVAAQADPMDFVKLDRFQRAVAHEVRVVCAPRDQLRRYEEIHFGSQEQAKVERFIRRSRDEVAARRKFAGTGQGIVIREFEEDLGQTPVEQLLDALVSHAVKRRATDIHVTCQTERVQLQHRVDGVLRDPTDLPVDIYATLLSRIKLSADMDISTHRIPQEGNFSVSVDGTDVMIRASVFPTVYGEDVALRLQWGAMYLKDLSSLGFTQAKLSRYQRLLDSPKGMILVTGPVGVGKSTTLYSSLGRLTGQRRRIVTLEDPVECRIDNITQSQVSPETGYDFALGLRSILRMDPNVIMVGEIRDVETARMALRASLTGMLVLSTLHTDRAAGAIPRLVDMDVEPYLLTSSLIGVLAQALTRRVCEDCRQAAASASLEHFQLQEWPQEYADRSYYEGAGCDRCDHSGYYGRTGLFELLEVNEDIRGAIRDRADRSEINRVAVANGMETMVVDGLEKAAQGITTLEEVVRVTSTR